MMHKFSYSLLGYPLGHTLSPFIHEKLFAISGIDGGYTLAEIPPASLHQHMQQLRRLDGFNVTIPHKQAILQALDWLDEKAALYGAVNTVKQTDGTLTGYNTDCDGFLEALRLANVPLQGNVIVCGAGGAARMAVFESAKAGCCVTVAVREPSLGSANALVREAMEKTGCTTIRAAAYDKLAATCDLLINATPAGMHPNTGTMAPNAVTVQGAKAVFDCVYNPIETKLLQLARANGSICVGGTPMLVLQAASAHAIWYGAAFTPEQLRAVIAQTETQLTRRAL